MKTEINEIGFLCAIAGGDKSNRQVTARPGSGIGIPARH